MDVLKPLWIFMEYDPDRSMRVVRDVVNASSQPFSFTFIKGERGRWLIPTMCLHGNLALFIENGVTINGDMARFWKEIKQQELCAVYVPKGEKDSPAPSMMLFRNKYCERLTPAYVYHATPEQLAPSVWAGGPQNVGILEV